MAEATPLGLEVQAFVDHGDLVPDSVMLRVIEQRLAQGDVRRHGFLIDGFPRTIEQAEGFAEIVGAETLCGAIQIEVPTDVVLARILGRRVCPDLRHDDIGPARLPRIPAPVETDGRCAARTTPRPRSVAA